MERQQELKVLLKRWEAEFLRETAAKAQPGAPEGPRREFADIEEAPEETRRLYKEYRMLKQQGKISDSSGKMGSQETPNVEQVFENPWTSGLSKISP